jgi:hypothetical protein
MKAYMCIEKKNFNPQLTIPPCSYSGGTGDCPAIDVGAYLFWQDQWPRMWIHLVFTVTGLVAVAIAVGVGIQLGPPTAGGPLLRLCDGVSSAVQVDP